MENKYLVGVDLGGTTVKIAFIRLNGEIVVKWEIPTNKVSNTIVQDIAEAIKQKVNEIGFEYKDLIGIGMGAPGPVELETGLVYNAVNLGWDHYPLKEELEKYTGLPAIIDNDANIAALGEMWKGAGNNAKDLICVTLGTGVGGGIIANGEVIHGVLGAGGEIGHITVVPEGGAPCNCGKTGCLETVASATGIVRLALERIQHQNVNSTLKEKYKQAGFISAKDVFDAARKEDAIGKSVIDEMSFYLGLAIANLSTSLNPKKVIIGGGVSKGADLFLHKVQDYFKKFAFPTVVKGAEIKVATLGNDAGVIGGAWLVKTKLMK
ncbi:ROK family glucokinase [Bacillus sp. FJAT-47783]|uniref:ROK family glucokinase n=1 Tax=Bacillus sp. FJAT-47783 TaxID=2922712 RepID=UPI001FACE58C|nr:ROK family glucokinase [Bacillus sp. FJAT-47783]